MNSHQNKNILLFTLWLKKKTNKTKQKETEDNSNTGDKRNCFFFNM